MVERRPKIGGWPIAVTVGVLAVFLYSVRIVVLPFLIAGAVAFVTCPAIEWLQARLAIPRWLAATAVYVAVLAVVASLGYLVGPLVIADVGRVGTDAPQMAHRLIAQLTAGGRMQILGQSWDADQLTAGLVDAAKEALAAGGLVKVGGVGATALFAGSLVLVLLPYFLISGPRLAQGLLWLVPPEHRPTVATLATEIAPILSRYFGGIGLVVTYTTAVAWLGFGPVFRLAHAVLLAVAVGILELIPVIGPLSSAALVGIAAIQQADLWVAGALMAFAVALRLSIDQLVGPAVLGRAARVHPVVVLFAFLCGAMLFGLVGLVLAVPVAASIKIILTQYYAEPVDLDR